MKKFKEYVSNNKTLLWALTLPVLYCLWLLWYSCYYSEYTQLVKAVPALLVAVYLAFGYRQNRFFPGFVCILFLQVAIWILLIFDSQTAFFYAYNPFSLSSMPLFAIKEIGYFSLRTLIYLLLTVIALVKPKNTVLTKRLLLVVGMICVVATLAIDGTDFISQINNQFSLFYILFDYLFMWLTEFGYWFSFVLFVPVLCQKPHENQSTIMSDN